MRPATVLRASSLASKERGGLPPFVERKTNGSVRELSKALNTDIRIIIFYLYIFLSIPIFSFAVYFTSRQNMLNHSRLGLREPCSCCVTSTIDVISG